MLCGSQSGILDRRKRALYRCALNYEPVTESDWNIDTKPKHVHMGRLPIIHPTREQLGENLKSPAEGHEHGCPGSWYRCGFVASVAKYERILGDHGFSSNPRLDRCTDELILDAVQYLEQERLRCQSTDRGRMNDV